MTCGSERRHKNRMNRRFREIIERLEETSENAFITGRAGTGKSTLLKFFREKTAKNIAVLAPTGVAALNVQGQTIHSFFKLRPGADETQIKRVYGQAAAVYKKLDAVIIDEISMVRADILDLADKFLRINGPKTGEPFGGVQMVFFGDLFQLPPVLTDAERDVFTARYESPHFFDSEAWKNSIFRTEELNDVFRQTDPEFISVLDAIRSNDVSDEHLRVINERTGAEIGDGFKITLVTTNGRADSANMIELDKIRGDEKTYTGRLSGDFAEKNLPTAEGLKLKIGSQVMMLNNDQKKRWVNGDIARVTALGENSAEVELPNGEQHDVSPFTWEATKFVFDETAEKIKTEITGTFTQLPIRLAWAVTIHKGQGKTFDRAVIDLGTGTFAPGQAYVALSRVRSLEGLSLRRPIRRNDVFVDRRITEFMEAIKNPRA